ncbi:MAG: transposase [Planctomycetaceae bacterium]|nr:transposase [Planctomycetaceae bacterium]
MSKSRRRLTAEFTREAVQMIQQQGLSVAEAARRLDVHE